MVVDIQGVLRNRKMSKTGSEAETDEEYKRKRDDHEDCFGRSKITKRTPSKGKERKEETQDVMIKMMQELMNKNDEMMLEIRKIRDEQTQNNKQLLEIKQENENLKKEMKQLHERVERMEKNNKRKNLIVAGLKVDGKDERQIRTKMEKFMDQELQISIKLRNAIKIGDQTFVIETETMADKVEILKNKSKLRQRKERIYIDNDLTVKEREIQREIHEMAKEERNKGKRVKVGYKKLIVNGREWKWDEDGVKLGEGDREQDSKK